jgi:hypothetical protein
VWNTSLPLDFVVKLFSLNDWKLDLAVMESDEGLR